MQLAYARGVRDIGVGLQPIYLIIDGELIVIRPRACGPE
jgi:hypothetical protein